MKRIVVIGPSGAGKTTLASELSKRLGIPHTELDSIFHQANWQQIDDATFKKRVYEIAKQDAWVFCGGYTQKLGIELWQRADTVIWCDYSFPLVFSRLFRRTFIRGIMRAELWNGNREQFYTNFFTKDSIILWMMQQWNKQKRSYTQLFNEPDKFPNTKLVRLKTPRETREFLEKIR